MPSRQVLPLARVCLRTPWKSTSKARTMCPVARSLPRRLVLFRRGRELPRCLRELQVSAYLVDQPHPLPDNCRARYRGQGMVSRSHCVPSSLITLVQIIARVTSLLYAIFILISIHSHAFDNPIQIILIRCVSSGHAFHVAELRTPTATLRRL